MMNEVPASVLVEANLSEILSEVRQQEHVDATFPKDLLSFPEQMAQVQEWIEHAGEYGIAYESLVSLLERFPFKLSSQRSVKLLEVGLLMRFKTERPEDDRFDSRS